jgi:Trp operon repressor
MRANKAISILTAGLVFLVAIGSFALSYSALQDLAVKNGIEGTLSYIWPLLIDASLIVFSLAVVNAYLQSESTWRQWALVGIYSIATVSFNVAHAPDNLQAQIVAAIAPVSLFFSFELLMNELKISVKKHGLAEGITAMSQELSRLESDVSQKVQKVESLDKRIDTLRSEIEELQAQTSGSNGLHLANETRQAQIAERREKVHELVQQEVSQADMADELGVSVATIKRDLKA